MQPTNYCRQMVKQFQKSMQDGVFEYKAIELMSSLIDRSVKSQKFMLPEGGRVIDDREYRGLDEQEPLRLPFQSIAIEYSRHGSGYEEGEAKSTKAIVFAEDQGEWIVITPVVWWDKKLLWGPLPPVALPKIGSVNKSMLLKGYPGIVFKKSDGAVPDGDYSDELGALLDFLNALQCSNVRTDRAFPSNKSKTAKTKMPFDVYHILTIDVSGGCLRSIGGGGGDVHRSPREHLRRGHVRRLSSGLKIWVNATVVSAGVGAGSILKDYRLK